MRPHPRLEAFSATPMRLPGIAPRLKALPQNSITTTDLSNQPFEGFGVSPILRMSFSPSKVDTQRKMNDNGGRVSGHSTISESA